MGMHTHSQGLCAFLALLGFSAVMLSGQEASDWNPFQEAADKYGPEVHLVNGEKYYYPYPYATGHPFYEADPEARAHIWIRGKEYRDQHLRYDLYHQQIVLDFPDPEETLPSIVLRNTWVDQFSIGQRMFRKVEMEEGKVVFGQMVYQGQISCIFVWRKQYDYELEYGEKKHEFSEAFLERYLLIEGEYLRFKNKKTFLKSLPEKLRPKAKSILKQQKIRFRKATEHQLNQLLTQIEDA